MTEKRDDDITIPLTIPAWEAERLSVLIDPDAGLPDLEAVIYELLDHVQQGVYRPGAWERGLVCSVFGEDWLERLEPDTRPDRLSGDGRVIFDRPRGSEEAGND